MLNAFDRVVSRNSLLEKRVAALTDQVEKLKQFVASRGLGKAFVEFVRSLEPKTMKQKLADAKADAAEYNRQKRNQQSLPEKKQWQQEM